MDSQEGTRWQFPTDAFVEILLRLPPNIRRRFRLVSRHWREVVDESSFMFSDRPKTLVVTDGGPPFVVDDRTGRRRDLWSSNTPPRCRSMCIIGTCNGLVCLCDDGVPGGAITVANPVTGEILDVPPLPMPPPCGVSDDDAGQDQCLGGRWHQAYSFGYHPTTKRYKVVHVPCRFDDDLEFPTMQVFTLGEASWRDVVIPDPISACDLNAGIVTIKGTVYWTTDTETIMSFDLYEECVTKISQPLIGGTSRFMAEVHGKPGIVYRYNLSMMDNVEVWVRDSIQWHRWHTLLVSPSRKRPGQRPRGHQRLTRPHFALYSDHILTWESTSNHGGLYKHKPKNSENNHWGGVVEINDTNQGREVADIKSCLYTQVFAYVETRESFSVYAHGD